MDKLVDGQMGRPSSFTPEIADRICEAVAEGGNINRISQEDWAPTRQTIYNWFDQNKAFFDKYVRARMARADWRSDRMDDICRKVECGELDPAAARVLLDNEKWQAGKENPKAYGEKTTIAGDVENPIAITEVVRRVVKPDD